MDFTILDLASWSQAIRNFPERARDIAQTFSYNQLASKKEVANIVTPGKILILGGWYCNVFASLLKGSFITSVDIDPVCKNIGKTMNPHVNFECENALTYKPSMYVDWIINTSTEHMNKDQLLLSFENIHSGTNCVFQNNNNFNVEDHINCFPTLDAFTTYLSNDFEIVNAHEIELDTGKKRFTVHAIKR
jgi:hypothetical protein